MRRSPVEIQYGGWDRKAREHSDVRCHMWQLKSRTILVAAAFVGASCGGAMSAGPTAPTAAPDQRLAASVAQPVPAAVRPSAGPPGISSDPSGRLPDGNQGEELSDRIHGPVPGSIPHRHPAGSGPHRSVRFQSDGGTRQVIRAVSPRANRTGRLLQVVLVTVAVARFEDDGLESRNGGHLFGAATHFGVNTNPTLPRMGSFACPTATPDAFTSLSCVWIDSGNR